MADEKVNEGEAELVPLAGGGEPASPRSEDEPIALEGADEEPISLVESEGGEEGFTPGAVRAFGVTGGASDAAEIEYARALNVDGSGATRCRIFHSKIAVASLSFMEKQINEWLDGDQIEIKQIGHVIGIMEGKRPEPNLLVVVWY